ATLPRAVSLHDARPILVPSVQAARMTLAAGPEALQGAVAAGLLGCGSVVLGSSDAAGRLFADIAGRAAGAGGPEAAATQLVQQRSEEHTSELQSPDHLV